MYFAFFIGIMFKLDDKQKRNEAYLTQPLHETYSNQEQFNTNRKAQYLPCKKSKPTGICQDGTETCARVKQGACSHHGGVKVFLV